MRQCRIYLVAGGICTIAGAFLVSAVLVGIGALLCAVATVRVRRLSDVPKEIAQQFDQTKVLSYSFLATSLALFVALLTLAFVVIPAIEAYLAAVAPGFDLAEVVALLSGQGGESSAWG